MSLTYNGITFTATSGTDVGSIAGGLLTPLCLIGIIAVIITISFYYFKHKRKQKRVQELQRDIFTRYICL